MHKKLHVVSILFFAFLIGIISVHASDWMPDPTLRKYLREKLQIFDESPMRPHDLLRLYGLVVLESDIESLQGIEHAKNLTFLHIGNSLISDLNPLAGLPKLQVLKLYGNQISDISPLSGLTQLKELHLHSNQISDFTPLLNLTNLEYLDIFNNPNPEVGKFVFANPAIIEALRFTICNFEHPQYVRPVKQRIEGRTYPSVFTSQSGIENATGLETIKYLALADLSFGVAPFYDAGYLDFETPLESVAKVGNVKFVKQIHADVLRENPNKLALVEIRYYDGHKFNFSEDSPYWIRNPDNSIATRTWYVDAQGNEYWEPLINFTSKEVQKMIIAQVVAISKCGLYDGIWLDRWVANHNDLHPYISLEEELAARDQILQGIRRAVPEDFLILINALWTKTPRWKQHVNGVLIETWAAPESDSIEWAGEHYTHQDFHNYEEAIIWNEANLREPNFTLLYGKRPSYSDPQSPKSLQTMRTFTTLSLTHSDGYVEYGGTWYDFYDAPLGRSVGGDETKANTYKGIEGLFIREFSNGWAVYNRSGKAQKIQLPEKVNSWHSGVRDNSWHTLADLDGEIYIKSVATRADVNDDGIVNVLDLVLVANGFGGSAPDINDDGIVNVLDLVRVANSLSQ